MLFTEYNSVESKHNKTNTLSIHECAKIATSWSAGRRELREQTWYTTCELHTDRWQQPTVCESLQQKQKNIERNADRHNNREGDSLERASARKHNAMQMSALQYQFSPLGRACSPPARSPAWPGQCAASSRLRPPPPCSWPAPAAAATPLRQLSTVAQLRAQASSRNLQRLISLLCWCCDLRTVRRLRAAAEALQRRRLHLKRQASLEG